MTTNGERQPYAKGVARREEILDHAAEAFGCLGYHAVSMREVAATCGLSQAGLLHHFPNKEALMLALVKRRDSAQTSGKAVDRAADWREEVLNTLEQNLGDRTMTQLWATLAAEATDPAHPAHEYFVARYGRTFADFTAWFSSDRQTPASKREAAIKAHLFTALWDGLQLQSLLDPDFDMRPAFRYALTMLTNYSERP